MVTLDPKQRYQDAQRAYVDALKALGRAAEELEASRKALREWERKMKRD